MTWVKICGTTNLTDALLAAQSGADAIGFVLAPSKRRISVGEVAEIIRQLPPDIEKFGVFLNESPEQVIDIVKQTGLTGVQLHGEESPHMVKAIASSGVAKIVKGVHAGPALESELASWSAEVGVSALLLDSGNAQKSGGTGKTFDWGSAEHALKSVCAHTRIIVAGGLNPENVVTAIETFHPWGVDVVSGIESEPGKKDPQKVRAFIVAVRSAQK